MTKENAKDFLPLVQALADGKTIQLRVIKTGEWVDADESLTFGGHPEEYRVKPAPREFWLVADKNTGQVQTVYNHDVDTVHLSLEVIHVREVI